MDRLQSPMAITASSLYPAKFWTGRAKELMGWACSHRERLEQTQQAPWETNKRNHLERRLSLLSEGRRWAQGCCWGQYRLMSQDPNLAFFWSGHTTSTSLRYWGPPLDTRAVASTELGGRPGRSCVGLCWLIHSCQQASTFGPDWPAGKAKEATI